jgi:hypothetical protein
MREPRDHQAQSVIRHNKSGLCAMVFARSRILGNHTTLHKQNHHSIIRKFEPTTGYKLLNVLDERIKRWTLSVIGDKVDCAGQDSRNHRNHGAE